MVSYKVWLSYCKPSTQVLHLALEHCIIAVIIEIDIWKITYFPVMVHAQVFVMVFKNVIIVDNRIYGVWVFYPIN